MGRTRIEWTRGADGSMGETIQPIRGCSPASDGCRFCYAARQALRSRAPGRPYHGLVDHVPGRPPRFNGQIRADRAELRKPLHWEKPRRCFVCSMGDLFHQNVPEASILAVLSVLATSHRRNGSTFQLLTKRPDRALEILLAVQWRSGRFPLRMVEDGPAEVLTHAATIPKADEQLPRIATLGWGGIPPGLWLGASAENQDTAEERLVDVIRIPSTDAGLRILSLEPLLGPVWIATYLPRLDWVIVGAETGPNARPCPLEWIGLVVQQCVAAGVPVFVKATGPGKAAKDPANWPEGLRVRQWPA